MRLILLVGLIALLRASTSHGVEPPDAPRVPAIREVQQQCATSQGIPPEVTNSLGLKMVLIPPGQFTMGPNGSTYLVRLNKPYYIGSTEVTLAQYRRFREQHQVDGAEPEFNNDDRPVAMVSLDDALAFCAWLSAQPAEQNAGRVYSLPTEAQWEWAARAGTKTSRYFGDDAKAQEEYSWFNHTYTPNPRHESGGRGRQSVGQLKPNQLGLYDMLGNVWEWCGDLRVDAATGESRDPVIRGGSWRSGASHCTAAAHDPALRGFKADHIGFRVLCRCPETIDAAHRHQRVATRRNENPIICHRGASEFAHENTLEAYRATFDLGADGNEIDIRITRDGVLVCFHDDMLDHLLEAYGDVSDYTWEELQRFRFRAPGRFGEHCRIPTLYEVLVLHRQHAGLLHLDIKRPMLDRAISELLDSLDLWDHVIACNQENGGAIVKDPRLRLSGYKAGLYLDRSEVFPEAIAVAMQKPGAGFIVDDPRGAILSLGRKLGRVSREPVAPRVSMPGSASSSPAPSVEDLLAVLSDHTDWDQVAQTDAERLASGQKILARARACDQLLQIKATTPVVFAALEERVRQRSLHKDWQYHGLDGALALRTLILLRAPRAAEVARFAVWRDDPALVPVVNPLYKNPRSWTDFRVKMLAFPALAQCPGPATERVCRDYLSLSDEAAKELGPPQFEQAGRALLSVSPTTATALELLMHRHTAVRGRAILDCLAHHQEPWARQALEQGARHALAYVIAD